MKYAIRFGGLAVTRLGAAGLPADWRAEPVPESTQKIGDAWVAAGRTAILAVPSALYPEETNFVLNPVHPDFRKIEISEGEPFVFDPRMARLIEPGEP